MKVEVWREYRGSERGLAVVLGFMGLGGVLLWGMESAGMSSVSGGVGFWRGLALFGGLSVLAVWVNLTHTRKAERLGASRAASEWMLFGAAILLFLGNSGFIREGMLLLRDLPGFP